MENHEEEKVTGAEVEEMEAGSGREGGRGGFEQENSICLSAAYLQL